MSKQDAYLFGIFVGVGFFFALWMLLNAAFISRCEVEHGNGACELQVVPIERKMNDE